MIRVTVFALVCLAAHSASAQVIQLPSFYQFGVSTTVVVPDRGSAYLGGVDYASDYSATEGVPGLSRVPGAGRLFTNRTRASQRTSSHASVTATIIDLAEMDREILGGDPQAARAAHAARSAEAERIEQQAAFLSQHIGQRDRDPLSTPIRPGPASRTARRAAPPAPETPLRLGVK